MSFNMTDYVDVAERIREFYERYPDGSLQSEPGPTQFTRDSELMNAETAAWGRAIVAAGFSTKKIASAQEVRARQSSPQGQPQTSPPAADPPSDGEFTFAGGKYTGKTLAEVPSSYLDWYIASGPRDDVKDAIRAFRGEDLELIDIPF